AGPAAAEREAGPQDRHGQETELQAETSPTFALTLETIREFSISVKEPDEVQPEEEQVELT
ncbi:MAG: hypothetical protein D6719_09720, partial [Candidatus Dadabacteria bacterium]